MISKATFRWKRNRSVKWLSRTDALLGAFFALKASGSKSHVNLFEIGLYLGGYVSSIASNASPKRLKAWAIDPYPGLSRLSDEVKKSIAKNADIDSFQLFDSWEDYQSSLAKEDPLMDLVHIDGNHSYDAVRKDIREAIRLMGDRTVLAVDDYRHPYFPGVMTALAREGELGGVSIFLLTDNKAYACRQESHSFWFEETKRFLLSNKFRFEHYFREGKSEPYIQRPDVDGFAIILAFGANPEKMRIELRSLVKNLVPPIIYHLATKRFEKH